MIAAFVALAGCGKQPLPAGPSSAETSTTPMAASRSARRVRLFLALDDLAREDRRSARQGGPRCGQIYRSSSDGMKCLSPTAWYDFGSTLVSYLRRAGFQVSTDATVGFDLRVAVRLDFEQVASCKPHAGDMRSEGDSDHFRYDGAYCATIILVQDRPYELPADVIDAFSNLSTCESDHDDRPSWQFPQLLLRGPVSYGDFAHRWLERLLDCPALDRFADAVRVTGGSCAARISADERRQINTACQQQCTAEAGGDVCIVQHQQCLSVMAGDPACDGSLQTCLTSMGVKVDPSCPASCLDKAVATRCQS